MEGERESGTGERKKGREKKGETEEWDMVKGRGKKRKGGGLGRRDFCNRRRCINLESSTM
jgi:hypothetical protein